MATSRPKPSNPVRNGVGEIIYGTPDVPLGIHPSGVPQNSPAAGDTIMGVDDAVPFGNRDDQQAYHHLSRVDRVGSPPSGYTSSGEPTYGDGQQIRVTTWATDHEFVGKGEGSYLLPSGVRSFDYNGFNS